MQILKQPALGAAIIEKGNDMKNKTRIPLKTREICEGRKQYVKLMIEGEISNATKCIIHGTPVSVPENDHAHPQNVDDGTRAPAYQPMKEVAAMTETVSALPEARATEDRPWFAVNIEERIAMIDFALIEEAFGDLEIPANEQMEFLKALYQLMVTAVDFGFGLTSTDEACGKLDPARKVSSTRPSAVVRSETDTLTDMFNTCADE